MQQALPARAEWLELLTLEGAQGGMKATQTRWEDMFAEHIMWAPPLPPNDMNYISQGRQDVKLLKEHSIHAQKCKAVPLGIVPCEILAQILAPQLPQTRQNWRQVTRGNSRLLQI